MDCTLTPIEVRIPGCLIEKEATTPDVYPLTLNSLLTARNQTSSRDPLLEFAPDDLMAARQTRPLYPAEGLSELPVAAIRGWRRASSRSAS